MPLLAGLVAMSISEPLRLLKALSVEGELTCGQASELIKKKSNDHRDYHPLAILFCAGYVNIDTKDSSKTFASQGIHQLSIFLYMMLSLGPGKPYLGQSVSGSGFDKEILYITAEGHFKLDELAQKRSERIWAILIGIAVGISVAVISNHVIANVPVCN